MAARMELRHCARFHTFVTVKATEARSILLLFISLTELSIRINDLRIKKSTKWAKIEQTQEFISH